MPASQQEHIQQLDIIIDRMLTSATFRQQAIDSGWDVLVVVAQLIETPPPTLSQHSKQLIREQMLEAFEAMPHQTTSAEESLQERLLNTPHPTISEDAKNRIFDTMMGAIPSQSTAEATEKSSVSDDARHRIFDKMIDAQQHLQLDALVESDEGLELALSNDDALVQAAVRLRTTPPPQLSKEAKTRIQQQVFPQPAAPRKPVLHPIFKSSLQRVAASIAILLFVSMVAIPQASADSLPGDLLYPVKRSIEDVSLTFARSDLKRAQLHLNHAHERLVELSQMTASDDLQANLLDDTLTSLASAKQLANLLDEPFQDELDLLTLRVEQTIQSTALDDATVTMLLDQHDIVLREATPTDTPQDQTNVPSEASEDSSETPQLIEETEITVSDDIPVILPETTPESEIVETTIVETDDITLYANATTYVRVRSNPSLASSIVTRIKPADAVIQRGVSEDGQWLLVELPNGQQGWIAEFLLVTYPVTPQPSTVNNPATNAQDQSTGQTASDGTSSNTASSAVNDNSANNSNGNANGNANGSANGNAIGRHDDRVPPGLENGTENNGRNSE